MDITEVGYYWYRHNSNLYKEIVMVGKNNFLNGFSVWFFGSEIDMALPVAEKRGKFLRKVEDYADTKS